MQPALLRPSPERHPPIHSHSRLPANSTYRVPYAKAVCREDGTFQLIEQYYDAKDAYLCLVEIHARTSLSFQISCTFSDLYWLYQLEGGSRFSMATDQEESSLALQAEEYTLIYADAGYYELSVAPGHHLLFFFIVNARWLLRSFGQDVGAIRQLIEHLYQKHPGCLVSPILSIHDSIRQQLLQLVSFPEQQAIVMDADVYKSIASLIVTSQQDLDENRQDGNRSLQLAKAVRQYIQAQVRQGEVPPISEIVQHFHVSSQYLGRIHQQHYGYTVQKYIIIKKLEEAMRLLKEEGYSVAQVAYQLGYAERTSFYRQFKKRYGISPSEVKSRNEEPGNA